MYTALKMNASQDLPVNSGEPKSFTEHEIREALTEYVNSECCYKSEAAEKMEIQNIIMTNSYTYNSETVIETRAVSWKTFPYITNMMIDGPENGPPVSIWDVWAQPPEDYNFKKTKVLYEMPHTASTARCPKCLQTGKVQCRTCNSIGVNSCTWCDGIGSRSTHTTQIGNNRMEKCTWCDGRGRISCRVCRGNGRVQCPDCDGSGFIKTYQELQVSWEASSQSDIIKNESCKVPDYRLKRVTGETSVYLMNGCDPHDNPLRQFPDAGVRAASLKSFEKYNGMLSANNKRVLTNRQTLVTVLVAEATGIWQGKLHQFYVFGNERKVCFPRGYPQSCCVCT